MQVVKSYRVLHTIPRNRVPHMNLVDMASFLLSLEESEAPVYIPNFMHLLKRIFSFYHSGGSRLLQSTRSNKANKLNSGIVYYLKIEIRVCG